jgi:pSer/pThr/pTyr-binding forkhead associated (FHA) protein
VLGRASDADVHLDGDDALSRSHAEIAVRAGLCLIRDLDSCNGTLLNGRPVRRARLRRGDVLVLGETVVRVR